MYAFCVDQNHKNIRWMLNIWKMSRLPLIRGFDEQDLTSFIYRCVRYYDSLNVAQKRHTFLLFIERTPHSVWYIRIIWSLILPFNVVKDKESTIKRRFLLHYILYLFKHGFKRRMNDWWSLSLVHSLNFTLLSRVWKWTEWTKTKIK